MGKIYAVRMKEYNKGAGCLMRNWSAAKWGIQFTAGDATPRRPFRPSPVVEITKEQYGYLMGRKVDGSPNVGQPLNPSIPVFQGWIFNSRRELYDMVQGEADGRAAGGRTSARAVLRLREPVEAEEKPQQKLDLGEVASTSVAVVPSENNNPEPVKSEPSVGFEPIDVDAELAAGKSNPVDDVENEKKPEESETEDKTDKDSGEASSNDGSDESDKDSGEASEEKVENKTSTNKTTTKKTASKKAGSKKKAANKK